MLTNPIFTFFIGALFGIITICLMQIAKEADERIKEPIKPLNDSNDIERTLKIKNEYFHLIHDIGYDYDGCNDVESLKDLVDELVDLAVKGLKNDTKSVIYSDGNIDSEDEICYNILREKIEKDEGK